MLPSTLRRPFIAAPRRLPIATRQFQSAAHRCLAKNMDTDKDSINTDSTEYSKSGGDDTAARATEKAAFDPSKTRPEEEHDAASRETGGDSNNPLNVSPANQDVSQTSPKGYTEGSPSETGQGGARARSSGGGSPAKSGGGPA